MALKQLLDIKQHTHSTCEWSNTEKLENINKLQCVLKRSFNFLPRFLPVEFERWEKKVPRNTKN